MITAETGAAVLGDELAAQLADLRIEPEQDQVAVGDRTISGSDPIALRAKLASALYESWHAGMAARPAESASPSPHRDAEFEQQLADCVPHTVSATPAVVHALPDDEDPGHGVAEVNRVRVRVAAADLAGRAAGDRVTLALPALRPMLSPGFLLVSGASGSTSAGPTLRLYVHVAEAAQAPAAWRSVLEHLEDRHAHYRAKVLSRRELYPRRDAIVVYLPESSWSYVPDLAAAVADAAALGGPTSPFAHRIGPGLALAWEPDDERPGWRRVSFGQHRARAVARGVVRTMSDGVPLECAVAEELTAAGADPAAPARNLGSPEFPASLPA